MYYTKLYAVETNTDVKTIYIVHMVYRPPRLVYIYISPELYTT